mgnify:CR=1 FL=1
MSALSTKGQKTLAKLNQPLKHTDSTSNAAASNAIADHVHGYDVKALPNGMRVLSRPAKGNDMTMPKLTLLDATANDAPLQRSSDRHWIKGKHVAKRQAVDTQIKALRQHNYQLLRRLKNALDTGKLELAFKFIDIIAKDRMRQMELNTQWKAIQDAIAEAEKARVVQPSKFKTIVKAKRYARFSEK